MRASSVGDDSRESSPLVAMTAERLLVGIVSGTYQPGTRLPPERDLAPALGASRATLREAFRQLEGMHLIAARRGSGVTVRPLRDWNIDVLPVYLAAGAPYSRGGVKELVREMLVLRRDLDATMIRVVAPRLAPGSLATARAAAIHAWEQRDSSASFAEREMAVLQEMVAAAQVHPTQWLFNTLTAVYLKCARIIPAFAVVPPDYLEVFVRVADALEAQRADEAAALIGAYFQRTDEALLQRMG
jgi:GntR family transcriptional repressor for pyruvate dehydrogenase complex